MLRGALVFTCTLFVSAALLFTCQPLVARLIMPILGGTPSVWIVCSLCSQALLLAGYGYAHLVGTRLPIRAQIAVQLALVAAVFLVLPIAVDSVVAERMTAAYPTLGVVLLVLRTNGLTFFVLSSTSPLLQRWIVELGEDDPYYLYVASNAGSMLSLLGYPFVLEPMLTLGAQSRALSIGYALYAALVSGCAFVTLRARRGVTKARTPLEEAAPAPLVATRHGVWVERAIWLALAFAPSSLLLSATQYVTTDIASVPFLWVAPLALYLGSFIIAFAKKPLVGPAVLSRITAMLAILTVLLMAAGKQKASPWLLVGPHFLFILVGSTACHLGLALRRPRATRLTEFYFIISLGGVLGGMFNGLLAPAIFTDLYEYAIAFGFIGASRLALEPASSPTETSEPRYGRDVAYGLGISLLAFVAVWVGSRYRVDVRKGFLFMFGLPLFVVYVWKSRPLRFGIALGGIALASMVYASRADARLVHRERSFFGVLAVLDDTAGGFRTLVHGRTYHGREAFDPKERDRPTSYYSREGPAGDVLGFREGTHQIGVIGLGVGDLAKYARPGDTWTFFELDPHILEVARTYFTTLATAEKVAPIAVEIGDGRLRLAHGPAARFDILVLDAFSSDGIPVHLMTREAVAAYRRVLKPGGLILVHASNANLYLPPVVGALARDAGLQAIMRFDHADEERMRNGVEESIWVLLSEAAIAREGWKPIVIPANQPVWTDDFSNLLGALR